MDNLKSYFFCSSYSISGAAALGGGVAQIADAVAAARYHGVVTPQHTVRRIPFKQEFRSIGLPAALFIAAIKGLFAFLTRGVSAGLMSLCGGLLSTLIMGILWKKTKFTPVFIGVCGAFGHNLAQLLVALWLTGFGALGYIPALALYSVVCGICTGLLLQVLLPLLEKLPVLRK